MVIGDIGAPWLAVLTVALGCNAIAGIDDLHPVTAGSTTAAQTSGGGVIGDGGGGRPNVASSSSVGGAGVGGAGGGAPMTCTEQYGHVPFFMHCSGSDDACMFYAHVEPHSCALLCQSGGGECLGVYNNLGGMAGCTPDGMSSCADNTLIDAICVCSYGCGSRPPCTPDQICLGGTCI